MAEALYDDYPGLIDDITQADTITKTFTFTESGAAKDVTGYKMYLYISSDRDGTTEELEVEYEPSGDPTLGIFVVKVTGEQTLALAVGTHFYSIKYIDGAALPDPETIDLGKFSVRQCVSNRVDQT